MHRTCFEKGKSVSTSSRLDMLLKINDLSFSSTLWYPQRSSVDAFERRLILNKAFQIQLLSKQKDSIPNLIPQWPASTDLDYQILLPHKLILLTLTIITYDPTSSQTRSQAMNALLTLKSRSSHSPSGLFTRETQTQFSYRVSTDSHYFMQSFWIRF